VRILVLGAYGLLGAEITRSLASVGFTPIGLVRSLSKAEKLLPGIECTQADISQLTNPADWTDIVRGFPIVINAAGALQTGLRDDLSKVQDKSIRALITACEQAGVEQFIQISAPGAEGNASTEFMRTKAAADAALRASALQWVVLKPGLVIGQNSFGGTALIRTLAGFPVVQPIIFAQARIQTVAMSDVVDAVILVIRKGVPLRHDYDLMERGSHSLGEVTGAFRVWMGFGPAHMQLSMPQILGGVIGRMADIAGWLGWRPPLRTTAWGVLKEGVQGDASAWEKATGRPLRTLEETLAAMPATFQERIFARAQLILPISICLLAFFFITSGLVGLFQIANAASVLEGVISSDAARALVIVGSLLDILLGVGVLFQRWARRAAIGMVLISLSYLAVGTMLTPHLWSAPLGPLLKIIPVIGLGLWVALLLEER
jgi:uncharacterized protein YbjT (DUF2867 family)